MIELRLNHPAIGFWVDVRVRRFGDAWLEARQVVEMDPLPVVTTA